MNGNCFVFSESKMATSANRRIKSANVTNQAIDQANSLLQNLPEKPKEVMSLREAVDELQEDIRAALGKGYSYDEIADILSSNGIEISVTTLKRYAPAGRGKRKATATKTRRRTRKGEDDSSALDEVDGVDSDVTESSDAPAKTTRKRGRSAAQTKAEPTAEVTETEPKTTGRGRRRTTSDASPTKVKRTTTRSTSRRRK